MVSLCVWSFLCHLDGTVAFMSHCYVIEKFQFSHEGGSCKHAAYETRGHPTRQTDFLKMADPLQILSFLAVTTIATFHDDAVVKPSFGHII